MSDQQAHWNQRYEVRNTPWNSGLPSLELQRVMFEKNWPLGRVLELGCGAGTNAVFLAEQGFDVTAVDLAPLAIEAAEKLARERCVSVNWHCRDVCNLDLGVPPFDYVFDRGCYHCVRRSDLNGYLQTLDRATKAGSQFLVLTGNANDQAEHGPPKMHEHEIRSELGGLFEVTAIRPFHFEDAHHVQGPLGYSSYLVRR